jgi:uncharacterized RDD family membrane protein YckC
MDNGKIIQFVNLILFIVPIIVIALSLYFKKKEKHIILDNRAANLWERAVAYMLDAGLCIGIFKILELIIEKIGVNIAGEFKYPIIAIIIWLYFSILESSKHLKSTLGKRMQGIVVVDKKGKRINIFTSSMRFIFFYISALYLFLGHITMFFTKYKTGIHDILSQSYVVKEQYKNDDTP